MTFFDAVFHPHRTATLKQAWAQRGQPEAAGEAQKLFVDHLERIDPRQRPSGYQALELALPRATPSDASSRERAAMRDALRQAALGSVTGLREAARIVQKLDTLHNMVVVMVSCMTDTPELQARKEELLHFVHTRLTDAGVGTAMEVHVAQGLKPKHREHLTEMLDKPDFVQLLDQFREMVSQTLGTPNALSAQERKVADKPEPAWQRLNVPKGQERVQMLAEVIKAADIQLSLAGLKTLTRLCNLTPKQLTELQDFYASKSAQRARELIADGVEPHTHLLGDAVAGAIKQFLPRTDTYIA